MNTTEKEMKLRYRRSAVHKNLDCQFTQSSVERQSNLIVPQSYLCCLLELLFHFKGLDSSCFPQTCYKGDNVGFLYPDLEPKLFQNFSLSQSDKDIIKDLYCNENNASDETQAIVNDS